MLGTVGAEIQSVAMGCELHERIGSSIFGVSKWFDQALAPEHPQGLVPAVLSVFMRMPNEPGLLESCARAWLMGTVAPVDSGRAGSPAVVLGVARHRPEGATPGTIRHVSLGAGMVVITAVDPPTQGRTPRTPTEAAPLSQSEDAARSCTSWTNRINSPR